MHVCWMWATGVLRIIKWQIKQNKAVVMFMFVVDGWQTSRWRVRFYVDVRGTVCWWVVSRQKVKVIYKEVSMLMNGFQIVLKSAVWFIIEAVNCSINMCSIRRFFQSVVLILFLVFQFMRIVFFAVVRAIESILLDVLFRLMFGSDIE